MNNSEELSYLEGLRNSSDIMRTLLFGIEAYYEDQRFDGFWMPDTGQKGDVLLAQNFDASFILEANDYFHVVWACPIYELMGSECQFNQVDYKLVQHLFVDRWHIDFKQEDHMTTAIMLYVPFVARIEAHPSERNAAKIDFRWTAYYGTPVHPLGEGYDKRPDYLTTCKWGEKLSKLYLPVLHHTLDFPKRLHEGSFMR